MQPYVCHRQPNTIIGTPYSILHHIFDEAHLAMHNIHISFCEEAQSHVNLHILDQEHTFTILNYSGVHKLCNEGDYNYE